MTVVSLALSLLAFIMGVTLVVAHADVKSLESELEGWERGKSWRTWRKSIPINRFYKPDKNGLRTENPEYAPKIQIEVDYAKQLLRKRKRFRTLAGSVLLFLMLASLISWSLTIRGM